MVKYPLVNRLYGWLYGNKSAPPGAAELPVITPDMMSPTMARSRNTYHDGEKYPGGFGYTELLMPDYWTLRMRSVQMFKTNLYARGIVRRLVTNIINVGLHLEATPDESILGGSQETLADWAESVENRFHLWEKTPALCDYQGARTFGALQAAAKLEALISGDVLVVLHQNDATGLPRVRLVSGNSVQNPFNLTAVLPTLPKGHCIKHGVELDPHGRHVAYWVVSYDEAALKNVARRLPAFGSTGRRNAWLVYGTDKLLDDVRGEPMLSIMLQSLREIDRYRDAVQRKAVINAMLAMFVTKEAEVAGSRPLTGGAVLKGVSTVPTGPGRAPRSFNFAEMIPGAVLDELAVGEKVQGFTPQGTDEKFADFEAAIVYALAWANDIPPEILTLTFRNNYSASQAAINEFKLFLNVSRTDYGDAFCQPIYNDWLLSETLAGRVKASGLLEAWRDSAQWDKFAAWFAADWSGAIKPSVDLVKQAEGYKKLVAEGFISRDRAARETTGAKYTKNVAKLARENPELAKANKSIAELENPAPPAPAPGRLPGKRDLAVVPKGENV